MIGCPFSVPSEFEPVKDVRPSVLCDSSPAFAGRFAGGCHKDGLSSSATGSASPALPFGSICKGIRDRMSFFSPAHLLSAPLAIRRDVSPRNAATLRQANRNSDYAFLRGYRPDKRSLRRRWISPTLKARLKCFAKDSFHAEHSAELAAW